MTTYDTREDAIAAAVLDMDDGDTITFHEDNCARGVDDRLTCTCKPSIVTKGAKA